MEMMDLYPMIIAEPLDGKSLKEDHYSYFLFNSQSNRGYVVDGLAALFCKQMNGKKKLKDLIKDFEHQYELEAGKFDNDIKVLLRDLDDNSLVALNPAPLEE